MGQAKIINLTPHEVNIATNDGDLTAIPRSGYVVRSPEIRVEAGSVNDLPVSIVEYDVPENLPPPKRGVIYVVSAVTLSSIDKGSRYDLFAPGKALRNKGGKQIGAVGLSAVWWWDPKIAERVTGIRFT